MLFMFMMVVVLRVVWWVVVDRWLVVLVLMLVNICGFCVVVVLVSRVFYSCFWLSMLLWVIEFRFSLMFLVYLGSVVLSFFIFIDFWLIRFWLG